MASEAKEEYPRWLTILFGAPLLCLFIWAITHHYRTRAALKRAPRYTIGYVTRTGYSVGPSSHSDVDYTYTVGDSTYQDSSTGDVPEGCHRCLLKFAAHAPDRREFYNHICVPDDVPPPPPNGWAEPPFPVPDYAQ